MGKVLYIPAMKYTLIGSLRSPFVRICRMLMLQNKIDFEFRVLNFVEDASDAAVLAKESPINKVPILVVGEQKIFDSRVIVNYLTQKHNLRPLSLNEENIVSAIYSCMDVGVILFLMKRDGYDINGPGFYLARQRERIPRNLEYVMPWARTLNPTKPDDWNFASMSLYCFLFWAEARARLEVNAYPDLAAFMERFKTAPGVQETSF